MASEAPKILVVEDNVVVLKGLHRRLLEEGFRVAPAQNSTEAIRQVYEFRPHLIILDLSLIDNDPFSSLLDGFALLGWLRRTIPNLKIPVILHTVSHSPKLEAEAFEAGIFAVCPKSARLDYLLHLVRQALGMADAA